MVIVINISYPTESTQDMAKRFIEAPQVPEFITRQGPYITADIDSGINSLSVWEVENAKMAEGLQAAGDYMATFFGVPGFKYQVKPYFAVEEALKMIGMG